MYGEKIGGGKMKKKAICQVEFEFNSYEFEPSDNWDVKDFAMLYLANALEESGYPYMIDAYITCVNVEEVK